METPHPDDPTHAGSPVESRTGDEGHSHDGGKSHDAGKSRDEGRGPRLREIPLRLMVPNLITVLAICAGLTGIRLAFEGRFEVAVAMVLLAGWCLLISAIVAGVVPLVTIAR